MKNKEEFISEQSEGKGCAIWFAIAIVAIIITAAVLIFN